MTPPLWDGKTRHEIERELRNVLEEAGARYRDLSLQHTEAMNLARDIMLGHSDGTLAFARVKEAHRLLLEQLGKYRVALRRFNRLVVDNELPDDLA